MQELADLLAREHVQLEFLLFKTAELHLLLRADETRFLRWAAAELTRAGERVRQSEARRAELIARLSSEAGLPPATAGLTDLAERSPEPWHTIFSDHSRDLRRLVNEVEATRHAAQLLATASGHSIVDALERTYRPVAFAVPAPRTLPSSQPTILP
jgi:hypothetical protein